MDATLESNNPKLQNVKYVNILPEGKQANYKQLERVDYMPDPSTAPYFDGAQSYLNIQVRNTSTFDIGNSGNPATAAPPVCFPANMGVNAIFNRVLVRAKDNGQVIEDIESYNLLNSLKNAYTKDSDIFKTMGRITGVAGRTPCPMNQTVDNLAVNYFLPNGEVASNAITGGGEAVSAQFCVPVETGLFSAFKNHQVVPNLDVPLHLQMFLEKDNVALQVMNSNLYKADVVNGTAVVNNYAKSPLVDHAAVKAGTELTLELTECNTRLTVDNEEWDLQKLAFRAGMPITDGTSTSIITNVEQNAGAGSNQVKITVDVEFAAGDGAVNVKLPAINRSYILDKVELKLLLTIPDAPTMRQIRSQMARGISFTSSQLYKVSTSSQLVNSVLDIPEALTKVMTLMAVPVQQDSLEALDFANSYVFCRPDSLLDANTNNTNYQWQVQNTLIPNLAVDTRGATNIQSDNAIFFNQQVMSLRHWLDVKALADDPLCRKSEDVDIELPFFYPISLSPVGMSFNLINSAPQLRIQNTGAGANITAKLYHIFAIHTRILKSTDMGASVEF